MQNVHSHAWEQTLHLAPDTVREADISRGFPLDMTVKIDTFLKDNEPFEKVVVFGMKARLSGFWVPDDFIANFVAEAPEKLYGFASCDPTQPGYMDELRHGIEDLRLVGVKMGPMYAGFDPRDGRCTPVYDYCQERGLPVLFHTGTTFIRVAPLEMTRPWLFDEVAIKFPELRMVLAHVGHPFGEECLVVIRKHPHVYADISAIYYRPWQFYNMMIVAQEYRVTHKLLFGTDYPFAGGIDSIEGLRNANHVIGDSSLPRISDEVVEDILHRDSFSLLGHPVIITDVEAIVLDTGKDYPDPAAAGEAHGVRFVSLLKISTDEGITGWSDIETQPHVGKAIVDAPSGGAIGFEGLRRALISEDPLERERLWQKMYRFLAYYGRDGAGMQMISGADIALWDIAGKAFQQPVHKLLGAKYRDSVTAYASTLFRPTPDGMRKAVDDYVERGFRAIKFGWGVFGYDLALDVALVRAAREEAGPGVTLMVDAGWYGTRYEEPFKSRSLRDWIRLVRALEELDVFWLEDFLHPENIAGYRAVAEKCTTLRVAAGEQYAGYADFERLAIEGGVDVLQPDLSRCGGLTIGKQIADLATRRQIDCVPHAWLTDLLKAASLHLNAYLMRSLYLEFNVSSASLLNNLCTMRVEMVDGQIPVPTGPGLGVEVDEEMVARYRVA